MTSGKEKPVVLAKKTTREVVKRYANAREAARDRGVDFNVVYRSCKKHTLSYGDFYFRYEDDFDPNESFENVVKLRPVLAVNVKTKHWLWFESVTEAGMHFFGYDEGAKKAMRSGRSKDGYVFVHADKRMRNEKCEVEVCK
jgi:hypothetical protein